MSMSKSLVGYEIYIVKTREEYDALKKRGIDILFGDKNLWLDIKLRKELQEEIFGKGNHQTANQKYYRMVWNHNLSYNGRGHYCDECKKPLEAYSATYVSHILSRGAYPEMAYDLRNHNILCAQCHQKWENGNREEMRIYKKNIATINTLKREYRNADNNEIQAD